MKVRYHADTDALDIDLSEQVSEESREVADGIVLDYCSDSTRASASGVFQRPR